MKTLNCTILFIVFIGTFNLCIAQTQPSSSTPATVVSSSGVGQASILPQDEISKRIIRGNADFPFLGDYVLYAGVQKTKIGTCTLNNNGTYSITVNSDSENHGVGIYDYDPSTKSLVWKGGLFLSNSYQGVFQKGKNGKLRIVLSKSTFAEKVN